MADTGKAVFLSYASQDAEAARRICEALRAAGVEVWFDQSELRGGDAWDAKIRKQIKECALFVPVISGNTQRRHEGYFRLEWHLAEQRSHLIARGRPFIVPVAIDRTGDAEALVPDAFLAVQWMRLPGGAATPAFVARLQVLLAGEPAAAPRSAAPAVRPVEDAGPSATAPKSRPVWPWVAIALVAGLAGYVIFKPRRSPEEVAKLLATVQTIARDDEKTSPPPLSEARQLADRGFAMSVDKYDSTLDDFTAAEELLKRALALDPNDGEIWARSAQLNFLYRNRGFDFNPARIATGREQAERAIRLAPDSGEALYALCLAQRYTGNRAAAFETLQRVVQLAPDHSRALLDLGSALNGRGRKEEGLAMLSRARRHPEWAPLADYYEYLSWFTTWRFAEADQAIRRSFAAGPSANNASGIGVIHLTWKGDLDEAVREFDALPPSLRNAPRVVWVSALVQLARRAPEDALQVLDRLPENYVEDSWASGPKALLVGRAHALAGRDSAARIAWEAGLPVVDAKIKADPHDTGARNSRGELLAWLGRTDEALAEARTVAEMNRGPAPVWTLSEARIYAVLGRADLAIPALEALLKPDSYWPVTPTLLRLDPLWDRIRDDPRFQDLLMKAEAAVIAAAPPRDWPKDPELKRAVGVLDRLDSIPEDFRLAEEIVQRALEKAPADPGANTAMARVQTAWLLRGWDRSTVRFLKAKSAAERAEQLAPDEPEAAGALALYLYHRGGDWDRALAQAQRAVALAPAEPRFRRMRDNILFAKPGVPRAEAFASAERTVALFPNDTFVHYDLSRHCRDFGLMAEFERENDAALALAPMANAIVWKARARFGLHGDLAGMKAELDRVPPRVRVIERTVSTYFVYAAMSGDYAAGLEALDGMPEPWMIDFDFRGPKAMLAAELLRLQGKPGLARLQYEEALAAVKRRQAEEPDDVILRVDEAWILHGLGREEEARAVNRIVTEALDRPHSVPAMTSWWFQPIPLNLLLGERAAARQLIREAAATPEGRATIRSRLALDPRLGSFRDDPDIQALLAGPAEAKK